MPFMHLLNVGVLTSGMLSDACAGVAADLQAAEQRVSDAVNSQARHLQLADLILTRSLARQAHAPLSQVPLDEVDEPVQVRWVLPRRELWGCGCR